MAAALIPASSRTTCFLFLLAIFTAYGRGVLVRAMVEVRGTAPVNMLDAIIDNLPEDYGRVTVNFEEMPTVAEIGIVIPTFSRLEYLQRTLESLRASSLPDDCMLVIVDETMASKRSADSQYEYFESIDFPGGDLKQIIAGHDEIRKGAEQLKSCVAFNDSGWLKHSLGRPRKINYSRFGTYINKSFLQENPAFHRQTLHYVRAFETPIDIGTVTALEEFDMDIPIIKIYKTRHRHMFDSLRVAWDLLVNLFRVRYLVNIDSDTIHVPGWLTTLFQTYVELNREPANRPIVLSGFNADTKRDLHARDNYVLKGDLGGINLFFDTRTYTQYIRNTLVNVGWDIQLSKAIREHNGSLVALRKSVIQHIGMEGMWSHHKKYDYSSTFQSTGTALKNGPRQDLKVLRKALRFMNSFGRK